VIERALDLGCNFVDCANYYGLGRSERIVGKALAGKRDSVVLTSKVQSRIGDGPNDSGLSRYHIMREAELSLQRLQTDHIDVYLVHHLDPETPLDETLQTLDDLVRSGKVRYIGCCNYPAWRVVQALWTSDAANAASFACVQSRYNLLDRVDIEGSLIPVCAEFGLGMMTYSPIAVGLLTGALRRGEPPPPNTFWSRDPARFADAMTEQTEKVVARLREIGEERGKTPAQVAIAWILDHPEVTSPIIGPDTPEHVDEVFGALGWQLEPGERSSLDEASAQGMAQRA